MLLGVFVIAPITANAGAYDKYAREFNNYYERENERLKEMQSDTDTASSATDSSKSFSNTYSGFKVNSPLPGDKFKLGEKLTLSITAREFYYQYYAGQQLNTPNYVIMSISKDGKLLKTFRASYYNSDLGKTFTDTYIPKKTGTYLVNINNGSNCGSYKFTVKKGTANPIKVKASAKAVAASSLKTAKQSVKPIIIKKAKGTVKVVKVKKGTSDKIYKRITINKKNGAITFKKGAYKKGTYKVKLKITAAGNSKYKSKSVIRIVKIKIK